MGGGSWKANISLMSKKGKGGSFFDSSEDGKGGQNCFVFFRVRGGTILAAPKPARGGAEGEEHAGDDTKSSEEKAWGLRRCEFVNLNGGDLVTRRR